MFATLKDRRPSRVAVFTGRVDSSSGAWELNIDRTLDCLAEAKRERAPTAVMGTAFNFVHLLDALAGEGVSLPLPPSSFVLETGGYKGRSRSLTRAQLHSELTRTLGIPHGCIHSEYGMSELSSQAYARGDGKAPPTPQSREPIFVFPPWTRVRVVSPEDGRQVPRGGTGMIRVIDLANVWSVMAVQTEDMGRMGPAGLTLLGRAALAEPRGCSLQAS
jgi:hypothetical protein